MNCISETTSTNLLEVCKKSVELYFFNSRKEKLFIVEIIVEILMNGFKFNTTCNAKSQLITADALKKLSEDLEWIRRSAQLRNSHTVFFDNDEFSSLTVNVINSSVEQILKSWTLFNLKMNCLCACLQAFIADRELLEYYYTEGSFLRSEYHATALFICLSALELNQCNLLSQIENCQSSSISLWRANRKRLFSSHPNLSLLPSKTYSVLPDKTNTKVHYESTDFKEKNSRGIAQITVEEQPAISMLRKVKSLPCVLQIVENKELQNFVSRSRSKTITTTHPCMTRKLHRQSKTFFFIRSTIPSSIGNDDDVPSTSTISSSKLCQTSHTNSIETTKDSSASSLSSSNVLPEISRPVEIIDCNDIKIWTDQSTSVLMTTEAQQVPVEVKSVNPFNSFLCNIFRIPLADSHSPNCNESEVNSNSNSNELGTGNTQNVESESNDTNFSDTTSSTSGVFSSFRIPYGKKLRPRKSQNLFYDDGISYLDYSPIVDTNTKDTYISKDQTNCDYEKNDRKLKTFLQTSQVQQNHTELEQENAHFSIAETIISVIEHIKWAKVELYKREQNEILNSTDWNNEQMQQEFSNNIGNQSANTENSNEYIPYAEVGENCLEAVTAEVVGLSLIAKFNNQWPPISELKWLVSEDDTPQQLLPMPIRKNDKDINESIILSKIRGTMHWAPPRKQIIFTNHPSPNRRELIEKQNNRCAGCGMRISLSHIQSFRYCTYLGKYHCTGCHRNQIAAIPAKILQGWDFKCCPVSVFAYRLLDQIHTYPLFYLPDLNPSLYERVTELLSARKKRVCLKFVKTFVKKCRFAMKDNILQYFDAIPSHIVGDPDIWSMSDFINTKRKNLQRSIDAIIMRCENHIFNCVLCTGRGFLCEFCKKDNVIYPWQNAIIRCDCCGSCFHEKCWKLLLKSCLRCQRMNERQITEP